MSTFRDHFSGAASDYAEFRPRYPDELFDRLASLAPAHRLAWDCATGNGQAALPLAEWFERVVATDASTAQIEHATLHPRVEYRIALAEASGLDDHVADLITVAQAAHWLDLDRFYDEVRRVAVPGAALALWGYTLMRVDEAIDPIFLHYAREVCGPYWPPERRILDEELRTIPFPFEPIDVPRMELAWRFTLPQLVGYLRSWSATRRLIAAVGDAPFRDTCERLAEAWGDPDRARPVVWPLFVRAGRVSH